MKSLKKVFILAIFLLSFFYGFCEDMPTQNPQNPAPSIAPNPAPDDPSLASPKTAKDYLNLGIEATKKQDYRSAFFHFKRACDNGQPAGCFALGTMYSNGVGVMSNLDKAERYYEMGCSGGDPTACSSLAKIYDSKDRASAQDKQTALDLYTAACQGGDLVACNNLAYMYATGDGVPKDFYKAINYYTYACNAGSDLGCYNLGLLSNTNNIYGYNRANLTTVDLNYLACNAGDIKGCANLGWIYANGLAGAPVSYHYAGKYFEQACGYGDVPSCNNLAVLYQKGLGVPQDTQRALDLFSYSCNMGNQGACNNYRIYKQQLSGENSPNRGSLFFPNDPNLGKKPNLGVPPYR